MQDLRYLKIKTGLQKLTSEELIKILNSSEEMVYDTYNFDPVTKRY